MSIYKESNLECEVKDLLELLMAKSADEVKSDINAEEARMPGIERIEVELKKLRNALNPTYRVHMEAMTKKKQSTRIISNNSGESIESRRGKIQDIRDESMRYVLERSMETRNVDI